MQIFGLPICNLWPLAVQLLPGYTRVACEPAVKSGGLTGVSTVRVSNETISELHERLEDATCGIRPQSLIVILPWYVMWERSSTIEIFNAKGKKSLLI